MSIKAYHDDTEIDTSSFSSVRILTDHQQSADYISDTYYMNEIQYMGEPPPSS